MFMYQIYTFHHTRATRLQGLICCILPLLMLLLSLGARAIEREPDNGLKLKAKADQYFQNEQFSEALSLYTQALEAAQADEDRQTQLRCLGNIGNVYAYMSDYDRAEHYFKKVYKMAREDRNTDIELKLAINLTQVCCLKGDPQEARQWYKVQMELPYPNTPLNHYYALANKSFIAKTEGSYGPALFYQQQALKLVETGDLGPRYEALAHQEMGDILFRQKQYARAISEYKRSYDIAHKDRDLQGEISVCQDIFVAYRQIGDSATADIYKKRYLELNDSVFGHQRMNAALNGLFDYENRQTTAIIGGLTRRNSWLTVVVGLFVTFGTIIVVLYLKLRRRTRHLLESQRLLVDKNEELMRQNDNVQQLRKQYLKAVEQEVASAAPSAPMEADATATERPTERHDAIGHDAGTAPAPSAVGLSEEQATRLLEKVNSVLEDVSVISREDFSLAMLAKMVDSNTKYVSMVINDTYGKNFKTYLNEFRIREACRRLSDTAHYGNMTIQAIYEQLGYKTASSFVAAFRKIIGTTPSQYQKWAKEGKQAEG